LTSEDVGLGDSDAHPRWIGVRRHQAALIILGVGLAGDGVVRARASLVEVVAGAALVISALPVADGHTLAEWAAVASRFLLRRRWSDVAVSVDGSSVSIETRGRATVRVHRLAHVGRLDLSGRDLEVADALASFVDAVAAAGDDQHLSLHVRTAPGGAATALATDANASPPPGWTRDDTLAGHIVDTPGVPAWLYERWSHVRTREGPRAVLRIRDFTGVVPHHSALGRVQLASDQCALAVHASVVATPRGLRLAERSVHGHRSDAAARVNSGFRRTARVDRSFARLAQRESQVAAGRALIRVACFVTVRAESLYELVGEVQRVRAALHEAGVREERGRGRQAEWYCAQMPGGPGW